MEKLVSNSFTPSGKVKKLILGTAAESFKSELLHLDITPIFSDCENSLQEPLNGHIDVLVHHYNNNLFFIDKSQTDLFNKINFPNIELTIIKDKVKNEYPNDVKLNCIRTNSSLICNTKTVAKEIVQKSISDGLNIINVKQGYTKCSTLVINENAVITDDESIFSVLKTNNYDVLLIKKGSVRLSPYNYGFIGGCGGLISKNEIIFFGNIKKHDSYKDIKAFLDNYKIQAISLSNETLLDIGSIIPLTECED